MKLPQIIQGGMGVGISNWRLANAVSRKGQLGVVSGTALDQLLTRRLQDGDPDGHMRRGLDAFPMRAMAERIWDKYYIAGGKSERQAYAELPQHLLDSPRELIELLIVANFVEVFLAREGHQGPVGINYLEKIQIPHLPSMYGAMLAGVAFVLMGAGIPLKVPGALDALAAHEPANYPLHVTGAQPGDEFAVHFDPQAFLEAPMAPLTRPAFLAIISSDVLALTLTRKANGKVNGFIVEGPTAGGHNAPPRGKLQLNDVGEPVYGDRDRVDLDKLQALGLPFWLAGGYGTANRVNEALSLGAAGVQVGTAFALCAESGMRDDYRHTLLNSVAAGEGRVFTDPLASPTGFPFKVADVADSLSDPEIYAARPRICDLGYLREPYRTDEGQVGWRCPAEPANVYASKGGAIEDTAGRKCICNALVATVGHPQIRAGKYLEHGIITSGDDLAGVREFIPADGRDYTAADVIDRLLAGVSGLAGAPA
ncbi:MAG: nitronate monooxygenase [Acidobacteria bacterium]|nr:nitronate monooxygenase [Acidobacteriota bacterium]